MADISTWSPVDESNTAAPPAGAPEYMQPSAVNNTMRAIMGAVRRFYDTVLTTFVPLSGGTMTGPLGTTDIYLSGQSIHFDGATTAGPYLQAANTGWTARAGSGNGLFQFADSTNAVKLTINFFDGSLIAENTIASEGTNAAFSFHDRSNNALVWTLYANAGATRIYGNGADRLTLDGNGNFAVTGNVSTNNVNTAGQLFLGGSTIYFNGNPNIAQGPFLSVDNTDWIHRLGPGAGRWWFESSAGGIVASIDSAGNVYTPLLQGGNGAANAGVLKGMPTADGLGHSIAFGWDQVASVFYKITDNTRTDTIPWSDTIRALLIRVDGGTPSGWHLEVFTGGLISYLYVDFTASDARMKRGIADSEIDALTAICSVPVRRFEWLDEVQELFGVRQGPVEIGLVAQELMAHMPDCVGISEGREAPYPQDTHVIKHDRIDAYVIRAIQQLAAENATLAARVAALEESRHV